MKKYSLLLLLAVLCFSSFGQTVVNSLAELRAAVQNDGQDIVMTSGDYELEDLPNATRFIDCSGSDNTIDMTGVRIRARVGSTIYDRSYFVVSGNNNVLNNGIIEDYYQSDLDEVTDFSAYNNDRTNLAQGLSSPVMTVSGNQNLVDGFEVTVKGSFPYGYGSQYGINGTNTFGIAKRSGILITGRDGGGVGNTLNGVTLNHRAFGHGIFIQSGADQTTLKNCYVEGRMRLSDDMYNDTETYDLPYKTDYKFPTGDDWRTLPFIESYDIPSGDNSVVYPLSEDGIRAYNGTGSVTVENCTVKQMRGGLRLYLAGSATVTNCEANGCGLVNITMPRNGTVTGSKGDFTNAPLLNYSGNKTGTQIELTITPSPDAIGPHNIADVTGNNNNITFHRTPGPLDNDEERAIVITSDNSTIVNETEYTIILESSASGNTITSCGPVIDNGSGNTITLITDCDFNLNSTCNNVASLIQAECFDQMSGIENEGTNIGSIKNGDWALYEGINLSGMNSVNVTASSNNDGGSIEMRLGSPTGTLVGVVQVENTGGWADYQLFSTNIDRVNGEQDLYLVFTDGASFLFNIDFVSLSEDVVCDVSPSHIEAECYDDMSGIQTEACSEGTLNVGYIENGDWIKYNSLDLTRMKSVKARVSGKTTGSIIEIRLGSETGTLIGELEASNTGGHQAWVSDSTNIDFTSGTHDVFLVFTGVDGYLFNINHLGFSEDEGIVTGANSLNSTNLKIYPNPAQDQVHIQGVIEGSYEVFDKSGVIYLHGEITKKDQSIFTSELSSGIYFIKITDQGYSAVKKISLKR